VLSSFLPARFPEIFISLSKFDLDISNTSLVDFPIDQSIADCLAHFSDPR
jgi:hypothetical protein